MDSDLPAILTIKPVDNITEQETVLSLPPGLPEVV